MAGEGVKTLLQQRDVNAFDQNEGYRVVKFIQASEFHQTAGVRALVSGANSGEVDFSLLGSGQVEITQVGTPAAAQTGIGGAAIKDLLDEVGFFVSLDATWDVEASEVRIACVWTSSGQLATEGVTWEITYDAVVDGDAMVRPATALDTTHPADEAAATPDLKINNLNRDLYGVINPYTFTNPVSETGHTLLSFLVGVSAHGGTIGTDKLWLLGVYIMARKRFI